MLGELYRGLRGNKITIQQSGGLLSTLHQLENIPSFKKEVFFLIQQLCYHLKKEVERQSSSSSQEKILSLIAELDEKVFSAINEQRKVNPDVQRRRTCSFSLSSTTKPIMRRYSTAAPASDMSQGMSGIFMYPQTPSSQVKRVSFVRAISSPELPTLTRSHSTMIDSEELPKGDSTFSGCELPFITKCAYDNLDDPEFMNDIFDLAVDHCRKNEYDKATPLYRQIFEKREKLLGYENFNTIMVCHNMALAFYGMGKSPEAFDIFNEMLFKLGKDHYYAQAIRNNMRVILDQGEERCFMQLEKEQEQAARSHFSGSASSYFQNTSTVDNGKGSCGSSLSSSSGFSSGLSTFSDSLNISKGGEVASLLSGVSGRTEQEQSLDSSKQNVSEVTKSNESSIREALSWDDSTSESSRTSSHTSKSVSRGFDSTGMSSFHKHISKAQETKNKGRPSKSISHPSTNMDNLQTEKHTDSSRRGKWGK